MEALACLRLMELPPESPLSTMRRRWRTGSPAFVRRFKTRSPKRRLCRMAPCRGKMMSKSPLEAISEGSWPTSSKARDGVTFPRQPCRLSAPGPNSGLGCSGEPGSASAFFSYCPGSVPIFREGKNAATLKQCRAALSFAYRHWNLINPFAKIDPPIQKGAPHPLPSSGRHPTASRLSQRPPARLWFGPRIPFGQRALPDGVPV